jgi:hypothetical protein
MVFTTDAVPNLATPFINQWFDTPGAPSGKFRTLAVAGSRRTWFVSRTELFTGVCKKAIAESSLIPISAEPSLALT